MPRSSCTGNAFDIRTYRLTADDLKKFRSPLDIVPWFALAFLLALMTESAMASVDPAGLPLVSDAAKRLKAHVEFLAGPELKGRKPGTPGHRLAARYITAQFEAAGLAPLPSLGGYGQQVTPDLGDNLIGARSSEAASTNFGSAPWILVGAHYDHLGEMLGKTYYGADDNGSAVAILLELARRLPSLSHHPLLFVAFNTEEPPFIRTSLMGSQVFVDHLPAEIGSPAGLHAVIIMDLMGGVYWEPLKNSIFAVGAEKSPALYRHIKQLGSLRMGRSASASLSVLPVGMHLLEELPVVGHHPFSDYDAFRNASVPFVFLSAGRTPHYHQPSDVPNTLHYERMAATVEWLEGLIMRMDQDQTPYEFHPHRIELADEIDVLRTLVRPASVWDTRIPGTSPLSLYRLKLDAKWLSRLDADAVPTENVLRKMERISIRMQCLLANFYGCGLF